MQRREFIAAVATAAAAAAPQAIARVPAAQTGSKPPAHPGKYTALETAARTCVDAGEDCLRRGFGMLAMKDTSMAACTEAAYELIAACRALKTLAAANSPHVPIFAKAVEQICLACVAECEKFPDIAEYKTCGDACKNCADECRLMV